MVKPFDLDTHVLQRYTGEARLQRLLWICRNCTPNTSPSTSIDEVDATIIEEESKLRQASYEAAVQCAIQQNNTSRYADIFSCWNQQQVFEQKQTQDGGGKQDSLQVGFVLHYDSQWYQETIMNNRQNRDILQSRLQASQAHLNKEAIRVAYLAVAEFAFRTGDVNDAFHAVLRAKDYCTTRNQTTSVTLQILMFSIFLRNFDAIRDYVPRLEHTISPPVVAVPNSSSSTSASASSNTISGGTGASMEQSIQVSLRNCVLIASGIEKLATSQYKVAAEKFRSVALSGQNSIPGSSSSRSGYSPESISASTGTGSSSAACGGGDVLIAAASQTTWYTNVLAPEDVSLYAAFLTLAVEDNRHVILMLAEDSEALELVPLMKEVLIQFTRYSNYKIAFAILEKEILPILQQDMYMSQHLDTLAQHIRNRAIVQFWKPYEKIELNRMAEELGRGIIRPQPIPLDGASTTVLPNPNQHGTENLSSSGSVLLLQTLVQLMMTNRSALGYDTRIDLLTNSLIRDPTNPEQERFIHTSNKLNAVSTRVLNDAYVMLIKASCAEHELCVNDPVDRKNRLRGGGMKSSLWSGYVVSGGEGLGSQRSICSDDEDDDDDEEIANIHNNSNGPYGVGGDDIDVDDDDRDNDGDRGYSRDGNMMLDTTIDGMNPEDLY